MKIHARFEKQPREIRSFDILMGDELALMNDTARATDPVQLGDMPQGLNVFAGYWVEEGQFIKLWVDDTSIEGRYNFNCWLWTTGGQRIEIDILFKIKE